MIFKKCNPEEIIRHRLYVKNVQLIYWKHFFTFCDCLGYYFQIKKLTRFVFHHYLVKYCKFLGIRKYV